MKRLPTSLCLIGCFTVLPNAFLFSHLFSNSAQAAQESDLYYTFYGQKIPLILKSDTIAVKFKASNGTRSLNARPLYQELQAVLQGESGSRGLAAAPTTQAEVKPLGDRLAIVQVSGNVRSRELLDRLQQQSYVDRTLPVFTRQSDDKHNDTIVLPNEIVLSFEPGLAQSQIQSLLNVQNLEVVRPLRFTQNRYIVRSRSASGTEILNVANRLTRVPGIQSATPNFVQSAEFAMQEQPSDANNVTRVNQLLNQFPQPEGSPLKSDLLPLQWHLNSTPQRGKLLPRTDINATEAWRISQQGKGTVVAVLDSVIQWDQPELANSVYQTPNTATDKLPGEVHGWNFAANNGGTPDTRLSSAELAQLRPDFQNSFKLSDKDLLNRYADLATKIRKAYPKYNGTQVANFIRQYYRFNTAAEFHGTWTSGVIAARPQGDHGTFGVAPQAQILPVRVFGLNGEISEDRLIEAIGYAASRGATVINMSLGGVLPSQGLTEQVFNVLDHNPKLAIVASAGNEDVDGAGFPAAIPGVISVGATSMSGGRSYYSSYGAQLGLVAPGGDTRLASSGGILTTGGVGISGLWEGMTLPQSGWGMAFDPQANYVQVQGTSFSAPIVSGVVALMQGERNQALERDRIVSILQKTSGYQGLNMTAADATQYRLQASIGFGTVLQFPVIRPSGIYPHPNPVSANQYFFGNGLINAAAAVEAAKRN